MKLLNRLALRARLGDLINCDGSACMGIVRREGTDGWGLISPGMESWV